jgi:predicted  nucleic acid-binding Zn-ribbon protein
MRKKQTLQQTERQLSAAKSVLQRERRKKERTSGKLAKQNAKRALKTLRHGVEYLEERRETLKEAR